MQRISIPINWAELDLYGHVNNVAYYNYMQTARIEFCAKAGLSVLNEIGKLSFILAASECHYKIKLHFPGNIEVRSYVTEFGKTSFHLRHEIYNQQGELAATGKDVLVIFDYVAGKKTEIPGELKTRLEELSA